MLFPWTNHKEALVRQRWAEGVTCAKIGAEIGVSHRAIAAKAKRLGLPHRHLSPSCITKWTPERIEQLKTLWDSGVSATAIAKEFKSTRNAILGKVHRLGLTPRVEGCGRKPRDPNAPKRKRMPKYAAPRHKDTDPIIEFIPIIDDNAIPQSQRKSLLELTAETCRWPVNEPGTPEFFFCGAVPAIGHPYCPAHCQRAYSRTHPISESEAQRRSAWYRRIQNFPLHNHFLSKWSEAAE